MTNEELSQIETDIHGQHGTKKKLLGLVAEIRRLNAELSALKTAHENAMQTIMLGGDEQMVEIHRLRVELANVSALLAACELNINLARLSALEDAARKIEAFSKSAYECRNALQGNTLFSVASAIRQMKGPVSP